MSRKLSHVVIQAVYRETTDTGLELGQPSTPPFTVYEAEFPRGFLEFLASRGVPVDRPAEPAQVDE